MGQPLPTFNSKRLVGLELELDCGRAGETRLPSEIEGWKNIADGSLSAGAREFILDPPHKFFEFTKHVEKFDAAVKTARTNIGKKGGFHVHVGAHDISLDQALAVTRLYCHFQPAINRLVGPSRIEDESCSKWCKPFSAGLSRYAIIQRFKLDEPLASRQLPMGQRALRYWAVNLMFMRCANPKHRSIEFRQGSPSRRTINIVGWACFCAALVEIARMPELTKLALATPATVKDLAEFITTHEGEFDGKGIGAWVEWRDGWLNGELDVDKLLRRLARNMTYAPHGLFFISRTLNLPLSQTKRFCKIACDQQKLFPMIVDGGLRFRLPYSVWASADLGELMAICSGVTTSIEEINDDETGEVNE